tara:strand:+ start:31 stop:177 length:147 start_codon:yes stop_codon:yes gene_type:complete
MARTSLHYSKENEWLVEAVEQERKKQNRPSINNTIESILVDYFKHKKK